MSKIGVLGSGDVGQALAVGLRDKGHEVRIGSRDPAKLKEFSSSTGIEAGTFATVAAWGEHLVLAVKGSGAQQALGQAGRDAIRGKVVIDTTNPIAEGPPEDGVFRVFTGPNTSLMEQLQTAFPDARFVKAFNSVGSDLMVDPDFHGVKPTMFYCGNDADAKSVVARLIEQLGWAPADMGTARAARAIEPLAQLWCIPGMRENRWSDHAFHMLQR